MKRTSRRLAAAAATSLLVLLAACGGGSSDTGNDGEGLVVYSGRQKALIEPLLKDFTAATGIAVTPRYGGSAELAAQLLEEGERTPAAVFLSQDAGALGALQDQGRLAPLAQEELDKVPARYRSRDGRWVGVSGRSRVVVYNPEQVPAASLPKSVFDLVKPQYKGKVAYAPTNASFQSFVTAMRVTVGEERTRAWLTGFKANEPKPYDGNSQIVDAVNEGQVPMGLVNHYYLYEKAAEAGGLDKLTARNYLFPGKDLGSLVNVAGVGVLEGKADARTQAFVQFLLGERAQTYFAEQTKEFPLVAGVQPDVPGLPALASLQGPDVDLSQLDTLDETLKLLDETGLT
ncbi:MAG: iron transporter substrate-binding protein [Frankiales bacterium]|nr:iron transporter substrate-binding protein [Frankiales bacterium]